MQMGFIEFVVAPLIIAFVSILPALHGIGANMQNNFQQWGEKRLGELMPKGTDAGEGRERSRDQQWVETDKRELQGGVRSVSTEGTEE
jgi:hypothetical protein